MEITKPTESFIFYKSFFDAIQTLDDSSRLQAYEAICSYALEINEKPQLTGMSQVIFIMAKPQIDANKKRKANSIKGGRPKKQSINPTVTKSKTDSFDKIKPNDNNNVNANDNDTVNKKEKGKENQTHKENESHASEFQQLFNKYPDNLKNAGDTYTPILYSKMRSNGTIPKIDDLLEILEEHKQSRQWVNGYIPKLKNWIKDSMFYEQLTPSMTKEEQEFEEETRKIYEEVENRKRWAIENGWSEKDIVYIDFAEAYNKAKEEAYDS